MLVSFVSVVVMIGLLVVIVVYVMIVLVWFGMVWMFGVLFNGVCFVLLMGGVVRCVVWV